MGPKQTIVVKNIIVDGKTKTWSKDNTWVPKRIVVTNIIVDGKQIVVDNTCVKK